jgi:O-acetyl-ADP-ribose deacetylase (regulator of RNase III)
MASAPLPISLLLGDITEQDTDVIVNAANSSLLGGGGVDGAIHRRGGPEILAACRELRASEYGDGLPTGQAVATTAGRLAARWVVHTVGPVWNRREDRSGLLASCYRESLRVAAGLGARTVAFPAVSTGVYGWPMDHGARLALTTVRSAVAGDAAPGITEVRFVLFDRAAYDTFAAALDEVERA